MDPNHFDHLTAVNVITVVDHVEELIQDYNAHTNKIKAVV